MKEKKVNLEAIALVIEIGMLKIYKNLQKEFDNWPDDENGTLVTFEQLNMGLRKLEDFGMKLITDITGKLPKVTVPDGVLEPEQPEPVLDEYKHKEVIHGLRFLHNKPFTWLNETGAKYGGKIKFVWPECGFELVVPDATDNYSPLGYANATYFCGTKNKPEESNGTRASVFGPAGCKATYVELYFGEVPNTVELPYETKFDYTTTGGLVGGKSLVLCPGKRINFDKCECDGIIIPKQGDIDGKERYWNMFQVPIGDIICIKDGKKFRYKADKQMVKGSCE